jgi:hypothetical protein
VNWSKRKITGFVLSLWLIAASMTILSCSGGDQDAEKKTDTEAVRTRAPHIYYQTRDAFSGKLVNRDIYSDYKGKRIFFCCENSKDSFLKDPERYMRRFKELGVALHDAPSADQDSVSTN